MKYVSCNYCDSVESIVVNSGPDLLLNRDETYHLVQCTNCGLIYLNPQLTRKELPALYPDSYLPFQREAGRSRSRFVRIDQDIALRRQALQVEKYVRERGSLLDVGCSTGMFLSTMRDRGWHVKGVELGEKAAAYAREHHRLDVFMGTLEEAEYPDESFDVVTLWDVLEHVPDPKSTLLELRRIMKPNSLLLLRVPNPRSLEARIFGSNWIGWDRPRHLQIFSPSVLQDYLKDAGLRFHRFESIGGRLGLTLLSLEFVFKSRGVREERWRPLLKLLYNFPIRLLSWPMYRMIELLNLSTNMTVVVFRD